MVDFRKGADEALTLSYFFIVYVRANVALKNTENFNFGLELSYQFIIFVSNGI